MTSPSARHRRCHHGLVLDQASKLWLLFVFDIAHRGTVKVTPFFDLVLAWNIGISFGWFQSDSPRPESC
jgi:signal peptidase II